MKEKILVFVALGLAVGAVSLEGRSAPEITADCSCVACECDPCECPAKRLDLPPATEKTTQPESEVSVEPDNPFPVRTSGRKRKPNRAPCGPGG